MGLRDSGKFHFQEYFHLCFIVYIYKIDTICKSWQHIVHCLHMISSIVSAGDSIIMYA